MNQVERYELIEELGNRGAVSVWRARDSAGSGRDVTLEIITVSDANRGQMDQLRVRARARARREPNADIRIFEDLERGMLGVAFEHAGELPRTKVDGAHRIGPTQFTAPSGRRYWAIAGAIAAAAAAIIALISVLRSPIGSEEDGPVFSLPSHAAMGATANPPPSLLPQQRSPAAPLGAFSSSPSIEEPARNAPSEEEWGADREEAEVTHSSKLGCETKILHGWFRARCHRPTGVQLAIDWPDGDRPSDAIVRDDASTTTLLVPDRGRPQRIRFDWRGGWGLRTLQLTGGRAHYQGAFDAGPPELACRTSADCRSGGHCCSSALSGPTCQETDCDVANQTILCQTDADCPKLPASFHADPMHCQASNAYAGLRECR